MNKLIIAAVPTELLCVMWPLAKKHIERVVQKAPDELTIEKLRERLFAGETLLMVICDGSDVIAANILEVRTFDTGIKVLYIPITGGERLDEWMDNFLLICTAIAKDYGCTALRGISVRPAWLKVLNKDKSPEDNQWKRVSEVIECKI